MSAQFVGENNGIFTSLNRLPILDEEIGSIYSGQILTQLPTEKDFEKIYKKVRLLGVDGETLRKSYFRVKVIDKERLRFCVKLLSMIANYIIAVENELYLQREIIRKNNVLLSDRILVRGNIWKRRK